VIAVVGSVNLDHVASVDELPQPGETVIAEGFVTVPGGKGANQAVAASRLGGDVSLIAALGSDPESADLREGLESEGVSTTHISTSPRMRSGTALITVDSRGENVIAVFGGANGELSLSNEALEAIESADVLLMQLEIPMKVVVAAAKAARGTVIVNAAPAIPLPDELVEHIDVLIVNEHERDVSLEGQTARQVPIIITTVGADGASVEGDFGAVNVAAPQVGVVDTTGAGDTFCGAVAEALARGESIMDAVAWGTQAGALATTGLGARGAMPTLVDMTEHSRERP
jgi:ribokinase